MAYSTQLEILAEPGSGCVVKQIRPPQCQGRVKYKGSEWPARYYYLDCPLVLEPGASVIVVGTEGITLLVLPEGYLSDNQLRKLRSPQRNWGDLKSA